MRPLFCATALMTCVTVGTHAVDVKMYGVVNKAVMASDDGRGTDYTVVDNNHESTRFGFSGVQQLDNGLTASLLYEVEQASNGSNVITQNETAGQSHTPENVAPDLTERMARVGIAGSWGALFLGDQDTATDDAWGHDLAAASSVMNSDVAAFGAGLVFLQKTGNTYSHAQVGGQDVTVGSMALGQAGVLDHAPSIRYNTPIWNGLNASLSTEQGGNNDMNVRYANEFGDFSVDGAVSYKFVNDGETVDENKASGEFGTSWSVHHKSGFGATLAYTDQVVKNKQAGVEDPTIMYAKIGYDWADKYGLALDFAQGKNAALPDDTYDPTNTKLTSYGVGGEWEMAEGLTLGATARNFSAKIAGVSGLQDIQLYLMNMQVRF